MSSTSSIHSTNGRTAKSRDNCHYRNAKSDITMINNRKFEQTHIMGKYSNICGGRSFTDVKLFLLNLLERIYENCATYNIRHCPFRGSFRNEHSVVRAMKEMLVLICFLAANFIVFLVIISRLTVHITYFVIEAIRWIQRSFTTKLKETKRPGKFKELPKSTEQGNKIKMEN